MIRVSIIVPCYNEQATIGSLLEAIYHQSYPQNQMEVIIADGLSSDRTREVIETFQEQHGEIAIHLIDNVKRTIPSALNAAIRAAHGEIIVRLDAHSVPHPGYIENCVTDIDAKLGDNVGGIWEIRPGGPGKIARSIALAAAHPLGVGDARYRTGGDAKTVETVPFGAFFKTLVDRIGEFDETLLTNEDYEFNVRVKQAGGSIWFDPKIRSIYFARSTFLQLASQYWRYGYWKAQMLRRYPGTIRWRQILPPVFVASLIILIISGLFFPIARFLFLLEFGLYLMIMGIVGLQLAFRERDIFYILGIPLSIGIMHIAWGASFLWSSIRGI
jgi:succinoglycan biosynthesis protein ExoA